MRPGDRPQNSRLTAQSAGQPSNSGATADHPMRGAGVGTRHMRATEERCTSRLKAPYSAEFPVCQLSGQKDGHGR